MSTATNVEAVAVNTIEWLSAPQTTIVVPVYQRQYRWDIGGCEQLLSDIRTVAASADDHRHFIGSILSAHDDADAPEDLILIDGQQRITTLMLLVAALHHSVRDTDPTMAATGMYPVINTSAEPGLALNVAVGDPAPNLTGLGVNRSGTAQLYIDIPMFSAVGIYDVTSVSLAVAATGNGYSSVSLLVSTNGGATFTQFGPSQPPAGGGGSILTFTLAPGTTDPAAEKRIADAVRAGLNPAN